MTRKSLKSRNAWSIGAFKLCETANSDETEEAAEWRPRIHHPSPCIGVEQSASPWHGEHAKNIRCPTVFSTVVLRSRLSDMVQQRPGRCNVAQLIRTALHASFSEFIAVLSFFVLTGLIITSHEFHRVCGGMLSDGGPIFRFLCNVPHASCSCENSTNGFQGCRVID